MYAVIQQPSKGMITGRVIDSQSEPYYPVAVSIEGLLMGGYTNEKGNFRINDIPVGDHTLVVSGLGVKTKKVDRSGRYRDRYPRRATGRNTGVG